MNSTSEILVVMVHLYEHMPDPEIKGPNIRWKEFSDQLIAKVSTVDWPMIYQLDFVKKDHYDTLSNPQTAMTEKSFGQRWNFFKQFGNHSPNQNLIVRSCDYVSTSDDETAMIIEYHNPKIVLFGGLHRDRCVTKVREAVVTPDREYHISNRLSYSWRQTWQDG
jgi:hypothetical protein